MAQAGEANDPTSGSNSVMNPGHVPPEACCTIAHMLRKRLTLSDILAPLKSMANSHWLQWGQDFTHYIKPYSMWITIEVNGIMELANMSESITVWPMATNMEWQRGRLSLGVNLCSSIEVNGREWSRDNLCQRTEDQPHFIQWWCSISSVARETS